jgi:predicted MFS family arabinose efflux permease
MLGGALLPSIALKWGWPAALLCVTGFGFLIAFAVQPLRRLTDEVRTEGGESPTFALALVLKDSRLRNLTVVSFVFSASQMCVFTFLVIDLVERIGMEYRLAGFALAIVQVGGFVSRLVWGYLSERWIPGRVLLIAISVMGSVSLVGLALTKESSSFVAIGCICLSLGMTIAGWNGIFLAEVVKSIPKEHLAAAVGTTVCFLYSGLVVGPALFSAVAYLTDSYPSAYIGLAVVVGIAGTLLYRTRDSLESE